MRAWWVVVALGAGCGDNAGGAPVVLASGDATLVLDGKRDTLTLARGDRTLLVLPAAAVQVGSVDDLAAGDSFDPYWLLVDAPPAPPAGLAWHGAHTFSLVSSSATQLVIAAGDAELAFAPGATGCFTATMTSRAARTAYFRIAPDADASEGFYGLGEWADSVDHRGKLRPMQMELDANSESMDDENHVPVPLVVGTNGWGLFVASKRPGAFDVARATPMKIDVVYGTGEDSPAGLAFDLFTADAPLDVLVHYYEIAGFPGLPAPWALGPLLWRDENANQAQVESDISQIRTLHLATTGIWFDRPYATGVETFDFSAAKFNDPRTMLRDLHDAGLRYGVWQAPYVAPSTNPDPAQPELDYANAHGFFPSITGVLLNSWGKPLDLTNQDAYAWWHDQLRAYTDALDTGAGLGVEGFKLDYAEDVVVGLLGKRTPWQFSDGSTEATMHYDYQLLYHQLHRELLPAAGGFLLVRTGRWGDQVHGAIVWPGDIDASFAQAGDPLPGTSSTAVGGLPAAVVKGIGLSASGFPFLASDTGGYRHSPANKETWVRWVEANAVWPAMEVGDASSAQPWEFTAANGRDQQALDDYALYARLHLRLWPYTWSYAMAMAVTGRPIVRPIGLAHPELGAHPDDEWLLGDAILVAPVLAAGATSRSVLLPAGTWIGWWDGAAYSGGATVTVPANLDTLPLLLAQGGIVPMLRDTIETLSPVGGAWTSVDSFASDAGVLWVRVARGGAPTTFAVYDGTQLGQGGATLSYAAGSVFGKGALFEAIATPAAPTSVSTGAGPLAMFATRAALLAAGEGWTWEAATGGTLWVLVRGSATVTVQ